MTRLILNEVSNQEKLAKKKVSFDINGEESHIFSTPTKVSSE